VTLGVLLLVYVVGWLSGICSVLFWDLMQHLKGK